MRVIAEDGSMMGVMPPSEALSVAITKGLDLVEIAPKAKPPTCKIMDYGKWKFKMSKKEKSSRKNQIKVIVKEVQLRPRTDIHDLEIKMRKAKAFLIDGCKVKVHLRYSGREMAHKELGLGILKQVVKSLEPLSTLEQDTPQMERRSAFLFFAPDLVKIKDFQKKQKLMSKITSKVTSQPTGNEPKSESTGSEPTSESTSEPKSESTGSEEPTSESTSEPTSQ